MKISISQTYFVNRTFVYRLSYKKIVDLLCGVSDKEKSETCSKYINDVTNSFFSKNEFSFSKNAKSFINSSKKELYKSDYAIFSISHDKLKEEFESFICNPINRLFDSNGILYGLKKLRKEIEHNINFKGDDPEILFWKNLYKNIDYVISQSVDYKGDNYRSCLEYYKLVRDQNRNWKNDVSLHPKYANNRILNEFAEFDKSLHDLEDHMTVKNIFSSAIIKCIVAPSKSGLISISFVVEYTSGGSQIVVDSIDSIDDVIREGNKKAEIINSRLNSVPKLFSYIDFNHLLGLKNLSIIDNLAKDYNTHEETTKLLNIEKDVREKAILFNNNFATYKCTHLRFVVDSMNDSSKFPMYFYDYVSLLTSHSYSYDSLYLWNVVNKNNSELERNDNIIDYIGKATEHMYIDDSSVLISVINPVVPNTILKEISSIDLPTSSHQLRIYSFWRFMYACNALAFGGMAVLASYLLDMISINYFSNYYNKIRMVYLYHKYSYLSSYVCSRFDTRHFYAKTSNITIANSIFSRMSIDDLILAKRAKTDELWKNANISNIQLYNRYGLILSVISLLITVISYGLVSAIFISEQNVNDVFDFLSIIFTSYKFYFMLIIALLPLVILVVINIVSIIYRRCNFSLIKESRVLDNMAQDNIIALRHTDNKKIEKRKKIFTFKRIIAKIKAIRK